MKKIVLWTALLLALGALAAVPALAQVAGEEPPEAGLTDTIVGTVTEVSGGRILVEEDPSVSVFEASPLLDGGDKGYFAITGETSISRLQGGELVPASSDDLAVGQLVSATYLGAVAQSYPGQGTAGSVVILDELPGSGDTGGTGFEQYDAVS